MLPMRSLRARRPAPRWRATGSALLSFHDRDHGDGRAECRAGLARRSCCGRRHRRCRRRGLAALLPARAGLHLQAGELLVLPPRRRHAARDRGRGQQHLRRAPLLPAGRAAAYGRELQARQGVPRLAVLPRRRAATASASCVGAAAASAPWCASTTTTRDGPLLQTSVSGALEPVTRAALRARPLALSADDAGRHRAHPLAGAAPVAQARALRRKPHRRRPVTR